MVSLIITIMITQNRSPILTMVLSVDLLMQPVRASEIHEAHETATVPVEAGACQAGETWPRDVLAVR